VTTGSIRTRDAGYLIMTSGDSRLAISAVASMIAQDWHCVAMRHPRSSGSLREGSRSPVGALQAQMLHPRSLPLWDNREGVKHVSMDPGCGDGAGDWLR
jgi:hypothetical protein